MFEYARKKKTPRRIENLEIEEISIVDEPANRRHFAIIKSADPGLAKAFGEFLDGFEKADISADAMKALKDALDLVNEYKKDWPEDVLKAIQTITEFAASAAAGASSSNGGYGAAPSDGGPEEELKFFKFGKFSDRTPFSDFALGLGLNANNRSAQILLAKRAAEDDDDGGDVLSAEELLEGRPKSKGISKALKGQGDAGDEGDDDREDLWPSL